MKQRSQKPPDGLDQTRGRKLAAEVRKKANTLSSEQREEYLRNGMATIYGDGRGTDGKSGSAS